MHPDDVRFEVLARPHLKTLLVSSLIPNIGHSWWRSTALLFAGGRYELEPYPGRILFFRARAFESQETPDAALGWDQFARGGLEIRDLGCNHFDMVEDPHAGQIALDIKKYLSSLMRFHRKVLAISC